jgi:hypothetical protein
VAAWGRSQNPPQDRGVLQVRLVEAARWSGSAGLAVKVREMVEGVQPVKAGQAGPDHRCLAGSYPVPVIRKTIPVRGLHHPFCVSRAFSCTRGISRRSRYPGSWHRRYVLFYHRQDNIHPRFPSNPLKVKATAPWYCPTCQFCLCGCHFNTNECLNEGLLER